jgi:hypothetical protein
MIGKVVFPYKSAVAEAVMEDDGSWRCDAIPCLARPLNILHSPVSFESRLDRSRCQRYLETAARWLHGEIRAGGKRSDGESIDHPIHPDDHGALPIITGPDLASAWMWLK